MRQAQGVAWNPCRTARCLWAGVLATGAILSGCSTFQGDYAKQDLSPRRTFQPTVGSAATTLEGPAPLAGSTTSDTDAVGSVQLQWEPADFDGNRRWDGFDVHFTPLSALGQPLRRPGRLLLVLHRFDPETVTRLGVRLLTWDIPAEDLDRTWDQGSYHFRLAWWQNKPSGEDYVVLTAAFQERPGEPVFTRTRAPVSIIQPRYETP